MWRRCFCGESCLDHGLTFLCLEFFPFSPPVFFVLFLLATANDVALCFEAWFKVASLLRTQVVDQSSLSQGDTMYRLHVLIDSPFVVLRPEAAYFLQYMSNHLMSRLKEARIFCFSFSFSFCCPRAITLLDWWMGPALFRASPGTLK